MNTTQRTRRIALTAVSLTGWLLLSFLTSDPDPRDRKLLRAEEKARPVRVANSESSGPESPQSLPRETYGPYSDLSRQTAEQANAKSYGCMRCHLNAHDPHKQKDRPLAIQIGCVDCHGGDPTADTKEAAHEHPRFPDVWITSGNPVRSYTVLNYERPEFVRFINPGDLRVAHLSCGVSGCHQQETLEVKKSMMTHGCMLWGAALYNNGAVPEKWSRYGESYSMNGVPQRLQTIPPPTPDETARKGVLPFLDPLPRFQMTQPGNVLRIFEPGGRFAPEVGIPERLEEAGRPRQRLSNRGLGTLNRTDPVFISLQKTRLLDPTLNFLGTNDHPGDYRSSGCTACHVIYANDRSPVHSGPFAKYGNSGKSAGRADGFVLTVDPTIPYDEPGHPVEHRFTRSIPTSQCIVCHIHPGTTVMNSFLGYMWWDMETDGEAMYPEEEVDPTSEQFGQRQMSDPNEITVRGKWADPEFLENLTNLNPHLKHTTFADFHGHGWPFKAVFKKDLHGHPLDHAGNRLEHLTAADRRRAVEMPQKIKKVYSDPELHADVLAIEEQLEELQKDVPVHMLDIHIEKGMHCVDCHFVQDVHGNTKLYGEVRAAIEIGCVDCHGTIEKRAAQLVNGRPQMRTSGPAALEVNGETVGRELTSMQTPFGRRRFEVRGNKIVQNSMVEEGLSWEIKQVADTIDPSSDSYNARAALAKTVRFEEDGKFAWGDVPSDPDKCAHSHKTMNCIACHSSWNPSCYGCHLPQKANKRAPDLHNEGDVTRNYVSYNFQTLREEVYMLARDGNVTGNHIGPARSSCAVHVTSYNGNRESIYTQQQTISGEGMSGIAFSTNVPHTVRGRGETKLCSDCHVSMKNDNNAQMAQLMMHGTNFMNFIGRYCWVAAGDHGLFGVVVTERDEPQTVIGSTMHKHVYPERYKEHREAGCELEHAHEHPGKDISENLTIPFTGKPEILSAQARGEFLYAACGEAGIRIFDIAFIDHKGFSERIVTAPVSPLGQRLYVRSEYATAVVAPTTIAPDPTRTHRPENYESPVHPIYANIYATDLHEGLIVIGVGTLLDGNPTNNFVERTCTFNPNGILKGAKAITIAGTNAYIGCDCGLVVVDLSTPDQPRVINVVGKEFVNQPRSVQVQFRYAFVCDCEGLKVLDVTTPVAPLPVAALKLADAHNVYVARNKAYVAGGKEGLVIVDVTNPEEPAIEQAYTAGGQITDAHDVKLGIYYASQFAFVADGEHGLRVIQLTSPETPGYDAFLPTPEPCLIATFPIPHEGHALAIAEGIDRDRAVDESGNQIAVFGRVGARPLNWMEQRRLYMNPAGDEVYRVIDGHRDSNIRGLIEREWQLHRELEEFYGESRSRNQPGRETIELRE
jgi:hypothetical protein